MHVLSTEMLPSQFVLIQPTLLSLLLLASVLVTVTLHFFLLTVHTGLFLTSFSVCLFFTYFIPSKDTSAVSQL